MKKRFISLLLLLGMLAGILAGCGQTEQPPEEPEEKIATEITVVEPEPEPEPEPIIANPLTGEEVTEEVRARRPYAVMLNNISVALPQYGITQADVIFEVLAEGGITRMLGLFQDVSELGSIGSVRSARSYYIDLTQGYDAVYIHAGGSPQAYSDLKAKNIDHIDGVNGNIANVFFRDQGRIRSAGYEHSMFTSGERLTDYVDTIESIRHTHAEDYVLPQEYVEDATPDGEAAPLIRATFPGGKRTSFEYDETTRLYKIYEYGAPYVDGATGEQVGVPNVLLLFTDVSQIAGDNKGRINVRTTGTGEGIFACGGKAVEIFWQRDTLESPFSYTLKNGDPLPLNIGHSFICIMPVSSTYTLTAE